MPPRVQLGEIRHSAMTDNLKARRREMSKGNGIGRVGRNVTRDRRETKRCDRENGRAECPQTGHRGSL